jgi:transcription antitermination factor NusG
MEGKTVVGADKAPNLVSGRDPSARGPVYLPRLTGADPAWFALYVQVNHEKELARRLDQKSIESYLPLVECWSKRRDRRKKIQIPLFPGYVFVRAVLDNYANVNILRTPGALGLIRNSEGPLPIEPYQIDNLKLMLGSPMLINTHPYLREGQRVRVLRGLLAGCIGILVRHNPKKGRLVVGVDIIQRSVSVEMDVEDVEPVAMAQAPSSAAAGRATDSICPVGGSLLDIGR